MLVFAKVQNAVYTGNMREYLIIPEVSEEQLLDKQSFYDFYDKTRSIMFSNEKNEILTKFCDRQIKLAFRDNDKQSSYANQLGELRRFLDSNKQFKNEVNSERNRLGLNKIKHIQKTYKNIEEASEDLLYQLWLANGSKGDFEKDILDKIDKLKKGLLSKKEHALICKYPFLINHSVDYLLDDFSLNRGWRDYVLAKIASPDRKQYNIPFQRSFPEEYPVTVDKVCDNSITITITPGFKPYCGKVIYDAFKPILDRITEAETLYDEALILRSLDTGLEPLRKISIIDLAKILYPNLNPITAADRLKKFYSKH